MIILGINAYHWDSSACIIINGKLIAAIEEERINRMKHWSGFPKLSIIECLKIADIDFDDIDIIAVGNKNKITLRKIIYGLKNITTVIKFLKKSNDIIRDISYHFEVSKLFVKKKIRFYDHHLCHVASSVYPSGFKNAVFLTMDAFGDFKSSIYGTYDSELKILDSVFFPHSLGILYTAITQLLGFKNVGDEYKVMGLAPYGRSKYKTFIRELYSINSDFNLELKYFTHHKRPINMNMRDDGICDLPLLYNNKLSQKYEYLKNSNISSSYSENQFVSDIAKSMQDLTEDIIIDKINKIYNLTEGRYDSICLAGGVGQNSVVNGKIHTKTKFKNVFIPFASHDAGLSIGAALLASNEIKTLDKKHIISPYLGSFFSNDEIISIVKENNLEYEFLDDSKLFDKVAKDLSTNKVVGWFQGKSEFGPRALGNRSILVDPRNSNAKDLLNKKIKRRESFRPFAPSILEEYVSEYFENHHKTPYMERVLNIREEKKKVIPAVTHIDGTGRLQTVSSKYNYRYHKLISKFNKITGVPILLNTSFNENEPIVNNPIHAINCFLRTKMDVLVLGNIYLCR
tara:strand:+ start:778 stop:2490 length:1713 start_codon:yes stop_codon:yes gene_type:complete